MTPCTRLDMAIEVESICKLEKEDVKCSVGQSKRETEKKFEVPTAKSPWAKLRREVGTAMKEHPQR